MGPSHVPQEPREQKVSSFACAAPRPQGEGLLDWKNQEGPFKGIRPHVDVDYGVAKGKGAEAVLPAAAQKDSNSLRQPIAQPGESFPTRNPGL